jgi:hypothetical protein
VIRRVGAVFVAVMVLLILMAEVQRIDDQLDQAEMQRAIGARP